MRLAQQILWATDLSELSLESGRYAAALTERLGSSLSVLYVFEPPLSPDRYTSGGGGGGAENPDVEAANVSRKQLEQIVRKEFAGLAVTRTEMVFGEPWQAICEYAGETGTDLIVLSTHGRTGIKHALLGSTAERVVQHAPCPVLVVKSAESSSESGEPGDSSAKAGPGT